MNNYIILALAGAILWSLADITTKHLLKNQVSLYWIILVNNLIGLAIVSFFINQNTLEINKKNIALLITNSILIVTGLILFYKSATAGKISIASAIMSTKIMWTMILASAILEEKLSIKEIAGILLILTGIILIQKGG